MPRGQKYWSSNQHMDNKLNKQRHIINLDVSNVGFVRNGLIYLIFTLLPLLYLHLSVLMEHSSFYPLHHV